MSEKRDIPILVFIVIISVISKVLTIPHSPGPLHHQQLDKNITLNKAVAYRYLKHAW